MARYLGLLLTGGGAGAATRAEWQRRVDALVVAGEAALAPYSE